MVVIHGTRNFLDRVGKPGDGERASTTKLGSWYATVLFWRPQTALFVNESTLLPVLVPFAPAAGLVARFRSVLVECLDAHGCNSSFITTELDEMNEHVLEKTRSRSILGVMNEFTYLANVYRDRATLDLQALSSRLADTPCGPLYKTHTTPRLALAAAVGDSQ